MFKNLAKSLVQFSSKAFGTPKSNSIYSTMAVMILIGCFAFSANAQTVGTSDNSLAAYRIAPEDILDISVWKEPDLQREVIVRPDGGISFPFVGDVAAAGKTPAQLQALITRGIQQYIPDALVTVSVKKIAGLRIYVIGKVKKAGQFTVGRYVDVLQALTLAGGLNPYASEKEIKILRREGGKEIVLPFNYSKVKDGKNLEQNIILKNDDVVVVP